MRRPDLGIGGRLAIAFGAVALLLGLLVAASFRLLAVVEGRTARYAAVVMPREEAAERLEFAVLYLGLAVRSYVLAPDESRLRDYRDRVRDVRRAVGAAAGVPHDAESALVFAPVPALTETFVARSEALVQAVRERRGVAEADLELARVREELLAPLRRFSALEKAHAVRTMEEVTGVQRETRRMLVAVALAVASVLGATILLTWRTVRVPVLALAETTRRVAGGDWAAGAALAGAPEARPRRDEIAELSRSFGRMAAELQRREERLAAQNEELQAQNEEIQSQSEEIQSQSEEIQSQSEELQSQSEQLQARNEELMEQGNELRRVNEALARNERRYRLLFENVSEGFALHEVVHDRNGRPVDHRFLEANPAFERLTGLARERVLGRTVREVLPGIEPSWLDTCASVAATGEPAHFDTAATSLGRHFEVIVFRPAPNQFATVFFDVTPRKRAEEALLAADRRKDEFLAVLSHELRNPLAPIRNALHLLERADGDAERSRRARDVIARQIGHLTRLVEDLLDITRISRGKVELQRTHVDLARLVSDAAQDAASTLDDAGVRLDVEVPGAPVYVSGDPARLAQVVGNLLQNAAKFTPRGGRAALVLEASGGRARIRVRDDGAGIAPEVLEHMFEPFVQEERSLARTRGGLGLGLSLVKGFVELHGGTVQARSDGPDRGAEFTIELPLESPRPSGEEAAPDPVRPRCRILLVEDNVDGAETLRDVLELAGHEVEVASDGASGVARARERVPDAVLCDVGLPDIDGYEVARRIRAEPALDGVLLVALTGYALPEDQRRAEEAGFDAHLAKPARLEAIDALLSRGVRRRARSGPA